MHTETLTEPTAGEADYHDWSMLKLERAAEQSLRSAVLLAAERGETESDIDVQRYRTILENIRQLRAMIAARSPGGSARLG